jgi:hypothetical protein
MKGTMDNEQLSDTDNSKRQELSASTKAVVSILIVATGCYRFAGPHDFQVHMLTPPISVAS